MSDLSNDKVSMTTTPTSTSEGGVSQRSTMKLVAVAVASAALLVSSALVGGFYLGKNNATPASPGNNEAIETCVTTSDLEARWPSTQSSPLNVGINAGAGSAFTEQTAYDAALKVMCHQSMAALPSKENPHQCLALHDGVLNAASMPVGNAEVVFLSVYHPCADPGEQFYLSHFVRQDGNLSTPAVGGAYAIGKVFPKVSRFDVEVDDGGAFNHSLTVEVSLSDVNSGTAPGISASISVSGETISPRVVFQHRMVLGAKCPAPIAATSSSVRRSRELSSNWDNSISSLCNLVQETGLTCYGNGDEMDIGKTGTFFGHTVSLYFGLNACSLPAAVNMQIQLGSWKTKLPVFTARINKWVPIPFASIEVPEVASAGVDALIRADFSAAQLSLELDLDVCGTVLVFEACASYIPGINPLTLVKHTWTFDSECDNNN